MEQVGTWTRQTVHGMADVFSGGKRDIRTITDQDMKVICDRLNKTPRKCIGWKSPAEVFRDKMMEEMDKAPYPQRQ